MDQQSDENSTSREDTTEDKKKPRSEAFLETSNLVWMRERPDGGLIDYTFLRSSIADLPRAEHVIIGFDTEYQSLKESYTNEEVAEGIAKYEPLSYQFYAINPTGEEWSGIVIPRHLERVRFTDFIVYAVSKGAELGYVIPKTIVLVGHYNRADVPAFEDKEQLWWRLNNVRNSLVSIGLPIRLRVLFSDEKNDHVDLSVYVRDTMLLAPSGRKSLASLGKMIGINKVQLADDPEADKLLKRRMKLVRNDDWELFKEYALADAEISARYYQQLTARVRAVLPKAFAPTALSNIGMNLLIAGWKKRA